MHCFFPDSIKCWNTIGCEFRSLPTISLFKNSLLTLIRLTKKSCGNQTNISINLGLSDLKSHKNSQFLDTPSDLCACKLGDENTISTQRIVLVDSISEMVSRKNLLINPSTTDLVNIYLYGNPELDEYENKLVLLATIKFITDFNRFKMKDNDNELFTKHFIRM